MDRAPAPGDLALIQDFVNTWYLEAESDEFRGASGLRGWLLARALIAPDDLVDDVDLGRAIELREVLRELLTTHDRGELGPQTAPVLERTARSALLSIELDAAGALKLTATRGGVDGALGRLLAIAFRSAAEGTWSRFKTCHNCLWAYYDHSKNRSGAWCSMDSCGSRVKARRFRARRRGESVARPTS